METNKIIGYVMIAVGFIVFVLSFPQVAKIVRIPIPAGLTSNIIMIVGLIVIAVGAFFLYKTGSGEVQEVPIYQGKEVVGFRRIKK